MVKVSGQMGPPRLSSYGRDRRARLLYVRGVHFVGAAELLRQRGGYEYVVLHLLCQGLEIVLKSLLLFRDFEKYNPRIRTGFGHKLIKLADETSSAYGLPPPRDELRAELEHLESLYRDHQLRYGSDFEFMIDPMTIPAELVTRRIAALIRLCNRHLVRRPH